MHWGARRVCRVHARAVSSLSTSPALLVTNFSSREGRCRTPLKGFYSQAPRYSHFVGNSGDGRQGMVAAQRYPQHFDGIVSGAPILAHHLAQVGSVQLLQAFTAIAPQNAAGQPLLAQACRDADLPLRRGRAAMSWRQRAHRPESCAAERRPRRDGRPAPQRRRPAVPAPALGHQHRRARLSRMLASAAIAASNSTDISGAMRRA